MEFLWNFLYYHAGAGWLDLLDILLVTGIVVWLYTWVKGTQAFKVLLGLGALILVYLLASYFGMVLTRTVLQGVVQALILLIIIIFAPEIRQVLERLNPMRIWTGPRDTAQADYVDEIIAACKKMARNRIGALIVIEREDPIEGLVRPGIPVSGSIREQTLISFFQPKSPTHDGAVWVRNAMIHQVSVFLPISEKDHPKSYGSRHRAALGISERSDVLVIVVSEERGDIAVVEDGHLTRVRDFDNLKSEIRNASESAQTLGPPTWSDIFVRDWQIKLSALLIVSLIWLGMAAQTEGRREVLVPVETFGLSDEYKMEPLPTNEIQVLLRGSPMALSRIQEEELSVSIDLSEYGPRDEQIPLSTEDLNLPPGVEVVRIDPASLAVQIEPKPSDPEREENQ